MMMMMKAHEDEEAKDEEKREGGDEEQTNRKTEAMMRGEDRAHRSNCQRTSVEAVLALRQHYQLLPAHECLKADHAR